MRRFAPWSTKPDWRVPHFTPGKSYPIHGPGACCDSVQTTNDRGERVTICAWRFE